MQGTMVSLIQSNFQGFGSGLVAGGFGLQDRGNLFNMAEGSANQCVHRIIWDCSGLLGIAWNCMRLHHLDYVHAIARDSPPWLVSPVPLMIASDDCL